MNTEREELRVLVDGNPKNWHGGYQWVADVTLLLDMLDAKDAELAEAHQRIAELATAVVRALDEMSGGKHYDAEEILRVVVRDD